MISPDYVRRMARYNAWQNRSHYREAGRLDASARLLDRGAFFGSIQHTLCHLAWGDAMWMHRFAGWPKPEASGAQSTVWIEDWAALAKPRAAFDARLIDWAKAVKQDWLDGDLTWVSGIKQTEQRAGIAGLVVHFFNHQTHHRGQVHAMLTAAGGAPDETDIVFMPEED